MGLDALRQGRWRQGGLRGADELVLGRRSTQLPHRRRAVAGAPFWLHLGWRMNQRIRGASGFRL